MTLKPTRMIAAWHARLFHVGILGALAVVGTGFLTSCSSNTQVTKTPTIAIAVKSGSGQSTAVNMAFANPLVATVTSNGSPSSGVTVTFSAPGSGATCALASSTVTTDASGDASTTCTASKQSGGPYTVTATTSGATSPANFSLTNNAGAAATITASSGTPQSVAVNTAFAPLAATVTDQYSNPVSGLTVTFSAPASGASGTFAGGVNTAMTNSSGVATAPTFTANATTGSYVVTATFAGAATPASFDLTNTAVPYAFYVSGTEPPNTNNGNTTTYYALAGAVLVAANGNVVGGEQDYINGAGITSPQPTGDSITGGTLTLNASTGQGTLTLITNNTSVGVAGTETLGVQFANANHALIMQFDGTATSSGSMDKQTLVAAKGNYAFTLSGLDTNSDPVGYGGVFSVASGTVSGIADVNDGGKLNGGSTTPGTITTGTPLSGTVAAPDTYGRGLTTGLTINGTALTLNYYVVGPEVIRIIDVDVATGTPSTGGPALGSAFGQGSTTFTASSLGASVLDLHGDIAPGAYPFGTLGMLTTTPSGPSFAAVVDDDERGTVVTAKAITGAYSISNAVGGVTYNGYGNLTITAPTPLVFVSSMGLYMTDPALNLTDPNNTTGGGGGLLLDLSSTTPTPPLESVLSGGTGVVIPQTDSAAASFKGNYAFGAQELFALSGAISEFDYVGQGSVSSLALSGTGLVNDPFASAFFATSAPAQYTGATFAGTATADTANAGRYTLPQLSIATSGGTKTSNVVIYQASGNLLLWQDEGLPCSSCSPPTSSGQDVSFGSLQQQGSLTGLPAARRSMAKARR
jgi:hypothetical protein